jgi:hypothetical protein
VPRGDTTRVFMSYRRADRPMSAGRIYDHLVRALGPNSVFMDVSDICLGREWQMVLHEKLSSAEVVLAIIGPEWLRLLEEKTRIQNNQEPNFYSEDSDPVSIELCMGLQKGLPVVPVLIDGASLPGAADLPEPLKFLPDRQSMTIQYQSFDKDCERLLQGMQLQRRPRRWF